MMNLKSIRFLLLLIVSALFVGCADEGYSDLAEFMADAKARPQKKIEPIPEFLPYTPFDYSAAAKRAPFDRPVTVVDEGPVLDQGDCQKLNAARQREFLEQYALGSLAMVGTLEQHGQLYGLVRDPQGNVHYVKEGDYLGKHHGKIVSASATRLTIDEMIPSGKDKSCWISRPQYLVLREVR